MNDEAFHTKFSELCDQLNHLNDRQLGELLSVSRPSIIRWKNRACLPHPLVRATVLNLLEAQLLVYGLSANLVKHQLEHMRIWSIGWALVFQTRETSSILVIRSIHRHSLTAMVQGPIT